MNVIGSGFIPILNYGAWSEAVEQEHTIMTESNEDVLTENSLPILIESDA